MVTRLAPIGTVEGMAKRAWRYRIIESSGCLAEQAPVGSHVIDWQDMGEEYTWTVYNFKADGTLPTGSMTGVFVDRGYKTEDGNYEAD